jgi:hypothetical protein
MSQRPMKVIRINYHANAPREPSAMIAVLKNPGEVRMSVGNATFMSATKNGLSLSPGWGKNINLQILPQGMTFAGMLIPKPFPLTLFPFPPMPDNFFKPPLMRAMPTIAFLGVSAAVFV